jgi:RNA polymerase sigma-70 factor (ECF subfamily)
MAARTELVSARSPVDRMKAIPALFREYGPRTYALALRITGSPSEAEDVVQETFLQAYRRWETFEGRADAGTWLYTIATRLAKRRFRRRKDGSTRRSLMKSFSDLSPMRDDGVVDLAVDRRQPADRLMREEARALVQEAILRLPPQYRVPVVMKDILEMPLEECAAALGLKLDTVKTRIHRARLAIRKALNDGLRTRKAPAPDYDRQLCLDLLQAKLAAMDKGRGFPIGREVMCERCQLVFAELDLGQEACAGLDDRMPPEVRKRIDRALRAAEAGNPSVARQTAGGRGGR